MIPNNRDVNYFIDNKLRSENESDNAGKFILKVVTDESGQKHLETIQKKELGWLGRMITWLGFGSASLKNVIAFMKTAEGQKELKNVIVARKSDSTFAFKLGAVIQKVIGSYNSRHYFKLDHVPILYHLNTEENLVPAEELLSKELQRPHQVKWQPIEMTFFNNPPVLMVLQII